MTMRHLTDAEIQQYLLDKAGCEPDLIGHLEQCEACSMQAVAYASLFTAIEEQPRPGFDFDLAALVVSKLPQTAPLPPTVALPQTAPEASRENNAFFLIALVAVAAVIGASLLIFREYLTKMITGMAPVSLYLIITTVIVVCLFQGIDLYKKYQKQLTILKYS